jgi:predicted nucleic acid-binding protein
MSVDCFLDTNVLVYAAAGRGAEEKKRQRALQLLHDEGFGLSAQVLQEFYVSVTRKVAVPLTAREALRWIELLEVFPILAIDQALVKIAVERSERFQLSYWHGAVIAAAEALGARTLYSEDLNNGQRYGSVRIENPFR